MHIHPKDMMVHPKDRSDLGLNPHEVHNVPACVRRIMGDKGELFKATAFEVSLRAKVA